MARRQPLCFIEPHDAVRVIADSLGREARRQLVDEVLHAWVDELPEEELADHYVRTLAELDQEDLHLLAAWHASLEVGQPLPSAEFLAGVFPSLGENRREALKLAVRFKGEEPSREHLTDAHAFEVILPRLSRRRVVELLGECLALYAWDRLGTAN
jgi:hypothetical protein